MPIPNKKARFFRALVVDDAEDVRILTARALDQEGIRCDQAVDGVIATNLMRLNKYDIVLVDLRMPRKHGHQLIMEVFEKEAPPLVIAVTGMVEPKLIHDLILRGVYDVEQKPVNYRAFAAKVKALLELRAKRGPAMDAGDSLTRRLEQTTATLKMELASISTRFQDTIQNLEQQRDALETGFLDSLRVLTNLINQVGQSHGSHAVRVERLCEWLARQKRLSREETRDIKIAALLHDIGQFGMPDSIHAKRPSELDAEERALYEKYPIIGSTLLSEIRGAENIVSLVESHTENFDGSGFPDALRGIDIPTGARIIRLADGIDTFQMHYEGEHRVEATQAYVAEERGRAFDPDLAGLALAWLQGGPQEEEKDSTKLVAVDDLRPGMRLAENIYDRDGRFLAREGVALSESMMKRLAQLLRNQRIPILEE